MALNVVLGDGETWWARVSTGSSAATSDAQPPVTFRMKVLQWERRTNDDGHPDLLAWLDAHGRPVRTDRLDRDGRTDGLRVRGYDRLTTSDIQSLKDDGEWHLLPSSVGP